MFPWFQQQRFKHGLFTGLKTAHAWGGSFPLKYYRCYATSVHRKGNGCVCRYLAQTLGMEGVKKNLNKYIYSVGTIFYINPTLPSNDKYNGNMKNNLVSGFLTDNDSKVIPLVITAAFKWNTYNPNPINESILHFLYMLILSKSLNLGHPAEHAL